MTVPSNIGDVVRIDFQPAKAPIDGTITVAENAMASQRAHCLGQPCLLLNRNPTSNWTAISKPLGSCRGGRSTGSGRSRLRSERRSLAEIVVWPYLLVWPYRESRGPTRSMPRRSGSSRPSPSGGVRRSRTCFAGRFERPLPEAGSKGRLRPRSINSNGGRDSPVPRRGAGQRRPGTSGGLGDSRGYQFPDSGPGQGNR